MSNEDKDFLKKLILATVTVMIGFGGISLVYETKFKKAKNDDYESLQIEKIKLEIMILKKQCEINK
jgi:hypothetical protein